ncbi:MAG: ABC transporter permease [Bacillota bacterium]
MKTLFIKLMGGVYMFTESVKMSISNIMHNRLRSFLTILGVLIGVTAVIALITTVSGVSTSLSNSFTSMGADTMTVTVTGNDLQAGLTDENMREITQFDEISGVIPGVSATVVVARGDVFESDITMVGRNPFFFTENDSAIERGRGVTPVDVQESSRVCVVNHDLVDEFFYGVDPIGQALYINDLRFTVVGIISDDIDESISEMISGSPSIIAPYTAVLKMNSALYVNSITVYLSDLGKRDTDAVETILGEYLDAVFSFEDDTYTITTLESIREIMDTMLSMMSALLSGIASISLVVGGIGIMNMMLTCVTERTMEIGMKKAIGAKPGQIQIQFLIEAFLLSMIGGIAGIILGIALSAVLCQVMGTQFTISYSAIALGVGFSAAVGILFGWSPARKASKLNPIDALRRI